MPTKSISTQQAQQVIDATHFLQISAAPCKILNLEGNVNSTTGTNYYLQILGVPFATAVSGTTVPLYSVLCVPSAYPTQINGFSFAYGSGGEGIDTARLNNPVGAIATFGDNTLPIYAAISTTDTVWTAVAASTNLRVDIEQSEVFIPNETIIGDLTTTVDHLQVYDGTNPANRLLKVTVINIPAQVRYLMLFAYAPTQGDTPITVWTIPAGINSVTTLTFGTGLLVQQSVPVGTLQTGCYLYMSITPLTYTVAVNTAKIKAWFI